MAISKLERPNPRSLGDNWVDAWLEVQDPTDHKRDAGYTYDSTIPFNGGSYSVRKRLDRILFWQRPEKEGGSHLQTTNCVVVKQSKEVRMDKIKYSTGAMVLRRRVAEDTLTFPLTK
jgi:hypothetical protein